MQYFSWKYDVAVRTVAEKDCLYVTAIKDFPPQFNCVIILVYLVKLEN